MSHSRLAANTIPIDRGASHEAACAGKLQVLLLMGSGVVAAAQIGKAIISVPMIRSDLAPDASAGRKGGPLRMKRAAT